jgi:hypothetical protein
VHGQAVQLHRSTETGMTEVKTYIYNKNKDKTDQNKTKHKTEQNKTKQNKTKQAKRKQKRLN